MFNKIGRVFGRGRGAASSIGTKSTQLTTRQRAHVDNLLKKQDTLTFDKIRAEVHQLNETELVEFTMKNVNRTHSLTEGLTALEQTVQKVKIKQEQPSFSLLEAAFRDFLRHRFTLGLSEPGANIVVTFLKHVRNDWKYTIAFLGGMGVATGGPEIVSILIEIADRPVDALQELWNDLVAEAIATLQRLGGDKYLAIDLETPSETGNYKIILNPSGESVSRDDLPLETKKTLIKLINIPVVDLPEGVEEQILDMPSVATERQNAGNTANNTIREALRQIRETAQGALQNLENNPQQKPNVGNWFGLKKLLFLGIIICVSNPILVQKAASLIW